MIAKPEVEVHDVPSSLDVPYLETSTEPQAPSRSPHKPHSLSTWSVEPQYDDFCVGIQARVFLFGTASP